MKGILKHRMQPSAHRFELAPLLAVNDFHMEVRRQNGRFFPALAGVELQVYRGECVGIVGESGCGKSLTLRGILALDDPREVVHTAGSVWFDGERILAGEERHLRGGRIGFIPQDPLSSLNPVATIGSQLVESIRHHQRESRKRAKNYALSLLAKVELSPPTRFFGAYPHQLSGGQRQRALIAIALAGNPDLLLADEPTTALDVTVQAQLVGLLHRLCNDHAMGLLFVSHDLALVSQLCDRIAVMYAGRIVESGATKEILRAPQHPYTQALLAALPETAPTGRQLPTISGTAPELGEWPEGCTFRTRCPRAQSECRSTTPALTTASSSKHSVACHRPGTLSTNENSHV
jgi:oligopeptide/dipeptide ABC transporter ATP-binding protein